MDRSLLILGVLACTVDALLHTMRPAGHGPRNITPGKIWSSLGQDLGEVRIDFFPKSFTLSSIWDQMTTVAYTIRSVGGMAKDSIHSNLVQQGRR